MTGYTRQSSGQIVNNTVIDASHLNNEYNLLQDAFDATAGHTHGGGVGEGAPLPPTALSGVTVDGLLARTSATTTAARTLTGTANQITVTNGTGVAGNPILTLPSAITAPGSVTTTTTLTAGTGLTVTAGGAAVTGNSTVTGTLDVTGILGGTTLRGTAGSAGTPTFSFTTDTNSGVYSGGADIVGIATGGTSRVLVDAAGNMGVGLTPLSDADTTIVSTKGPNTGDGYSCFRVEGGTTSKQATFQIGNANGDVVIGTMGTNTTGSLSLFAGGASRATISASGVMYVGNNISAQPGFVFDQSGFQWIGNSAGVAGWAFNTYFRSGVTVGSITQSGTTGVSYNTTSDYRLKENVTPLTDAADRVKRLRPSRFNFTAEPDRIIDGFLAHEVQEVIPEAVTGTKDGEDYQSMDASRLVPLLTAALQDALARIEALESKAL
jgi:hypothetical protein